MTTNTMAFPKYKKVLVAMLAGLTLTTFFIISKQIMYDAVTEMKTTIQVDLQKQHHKVQSSYERNYTAIHEERIRHLKTVCKDKDLFSKRTYRGSLYQSYLYSKKYNFAYSKIPKSGCTFWTQIFMILNNFTVEETFEMKRSKVHAVGGQFHISDVDLRSKNPRSVLVSRNPYSRLYSGYIDKVYLGLARSIRQMISPGNTECNFNITFEQFLQHIITRARANLSVNNHWAPIFSMSKPCQVNQFRLVKQETFSKDVELLLKELNLEPSKYEAITDALYDHRAEASIPGIVETVISKNDRPHVIECIGFSGIARRAWISLQIQGFIDKNIEFPDHAIASEDDFVNATKLSDLILETIRKYPLTPEEMKSQRHEALVSAYRTVSQESIEGIQDVYRPDFELFDYGFEPPTSISI